MHRKITVKKILIVCITIFFLGKRHRNNANDNEFLSLVSSSGVEFVEGKVPNISKYTSFSFAC